LRLPARCWRIAARAGVGLGLRDARDDDAVLLLDRGQVGLLVGRAALLALHGPARDDVVAEEVEELDEIGIARRLGDSAMELEVLGDRRVAALDRAVDALDRIAHALEMAAAAMLGGEAAASTSTLMRSCMMRTASASESATRLSSRNGRC